MAGDPPHIVRILHRKMIVGILHRNIVAPRCKTKMQTVTINTKCSWWFILGSLRPFLGGIPEKGVIDVFYTVQSTSKTKCKHCVSCSRNITGNQNVCVLQPWICDIKNSVATYKNDICLLLLIWNIKLWVLRLNFNTDF